MGSELISPRSHRRAISRPSTSVSWSWRCSWWSSTACSGAGSMSSPNASTSWRERADSVEQSMSVETLPIEMRPEGRKDGAAGAAPLIELRHVSKAYMSEEGGAPVIVLDDINLEVREGEMLALLGQSGSGKSTVLRLMAGLTTPTRGAVMRHGAQLSGV